MTRGFLLCSPLGQWCPCRLSTGPPSQSPWAATPLNASSWADSLAASLMSSQGSKKHCRPWPKSQIAATQANAVVPLSRMQATSFCFVHVGYFRELTRDQGEEEGRKKEKIKLAGPFAKDVCRQLFKPCKPPLLKPSTSSEAFHDPPHHYIRARAPPTHHCCQAACCTVPSLRCRGGAHRTQPPCSSRAYKLLRCAPTLVPANGVGAGAPEPNETTHTPHRFPFDGIHGACATPSPSRYALLGSPAQTKPKPIVHFINPWPPTTDFSFPPSLCVTVIAFLIAANTQLPCLWNCSPTYCATHPQEGDWNHIAAVPHYWSRTIWKDHYFWHLGDAHSRAPLTHYWTKKKKKSSNTIGSRHL